MAHQSTIPFPKKPWGFGGRSFPRGWTYGLMLPRYKIFSRAYLPGPKERMALGRNKIPFWHSMRYDLQAQVSGDGNITPLNNVVLLSMMATSSQAKGFRSQFGQLVDDQGKVCRWSRVGINSPNMFGTAQKPFPIKHPYPMPNLLALLNRCANLAL